MNFKKAAAGFLLASAAGLAFSQTTTPGNASADNAQSPASGPIAGQPMNAAAHAKAAKYASRPHLAYVRTGNAATDEASLRGLTALKDRLNDLTTLNADIVAVDIERDDISLFPVIYFPVSASTPALSESAQRKVQNYQKMPVARLIIFDLNNTGKALGSRENLTRVLGNVTMRRETAITENHPLTKTFFKVARLRGTFDYNDNLRVEESGPVGSEIVTSVIIGENNWAGAWAGITLSKGSQEQEMAMRAGINFVMLAMTGNYKADQELILAKPKDPAKN